MIRRRPLKTWTNSESHLQTSREKSKCYGDCSNKSSFGTKKEIVCCPIKIMWSVAAAQREVLLVVQRLQRVWQSDSEHCTKSSLQGTHAAARGLNQQ